MKIILSKLIIIILNYIYNLLWRNYTHTIIKKLAVEKILCGEIIHLFYKIIFYCGQFLCGEIIQWKKYCGEFIRRPKIVIRREL